MDALRSTSWLLSFGLHAGMLVAFVGFATSGGSALDEGAGSDTVLVEQGIAIEGLSNLGDSEEMIETVDIPPVQEVAEVKPLEDVEPEVTDVISSTESTNEEVLETREPEPIVEKKEVAEVPVEEIAPQVAALELQSSGQEQRGGDTTRRSVYLGKVRKALEKGKVNPRTRKTGTVVLKFTVSPSGEVLSQQILKSSGSKRLDDAALASLERAAPFPPMPEHLGEKPIEVQVPFKFLTR